MRPTGLRLWRELEAAPFLGIGLIATLVLAGLHILTSAPATSRIAGLTSVFAATAMTLPLLVAPTRRATLRILVAGGTCLAGYGLFIVDPSTAKTVALLTVREHVGLPSLVGLQIESNTLALLTIPAVVAATGLALSPSRRREQFGWVALGSVGALIVLLAGSRTATLAASSGALVVGVLNIRDGKTRLGLSLLGLVCFGVVLASRQDANLSDRLRIWHASLVEMSAAGPMGPGFGGFAEIQSGPTPLLEIAESGRTYSHPLTAHNVMLQTLLDFGVPGVSLLAALVVGALARSVHLVRRLSPGHAKTEAAIAVGCLVALVVSGLTESILTTTVATVGGPVTLLIPVPVFVLALGATSNCDSDAHPQLRR